MTMTMTTTKSTTCDDAVYTAAIACFNAFNAPMIYVPGDNEWTDCHRRNIQADPSFDLPETEGFNLFTFEPMIVPGN
jgi:hypothetical protein